MNSELRSYRRVNLRKKCTIEKRGIKSSCHLKDISLDGTGLCFVSSSIFSLHEHLIFDIKDLVDPKFQGVECVLRVLHISPWHEKYVYGCEIIFSNDNFDKLVEQLGRLYSNGSRLRFLARD
ncbi:PilZ domain-containing protein [Thiomicrorhabdus sp. 6S2-11]|jgi:c-di-GMP-binding flagellar brake protein YcgR|uniref:PilZ domain-containing protein n=1 Tax=Thiomicrorhabdus marina TaxID=2818442 RepID=A0ABS3Q7M3_9GAMM|nr:PilZ domain-containing protein [Thiomicrorhabdus marina]MBO1928073.1 PilZ domain-containing protein [Thiomicrorhabdus marina]